MQWDAARSCWTTKSQRGMETLCSSGAVTDCLHHNPAAASSEQAKPGLEIHQKVR